MSYLKLIKDKAQKISSDVCSAIDIDVTVTDENLVRICGTGSFIAHIDKNSPQNSLFARILKEKKPLSIKTKDIDITCKCCSNFTNCKEQSNMAYPIIVDNEVMGIVSFAAFNKKQSVLMDEKWNEYFKLLGEISKTIGREIANIKMSNKLILQKAEINELINSIDKGIIIVDINNKITQINSNALQMLKIDISKDKVIGKSLESIIRGLELKKVDNEENIAIWDVQGQKARFIYRVTSISLDKEKLSALINFTSLNELINTAMNYTANENITFSNIIGNSPCLKEVISRAKIISTSDSTVFLQGESGTGKELFARAIHNASLRKNGPFVAINCASIPENLLESELFGYEKGAFTGANTNGKVGKMELANNGTLFLDEIGDLPLYLQPKILRAIQNKEITRIGGNNTIKANFRIISATHKNLYELVRMKQFREDLYYRLNVIPLHIPPLRERGTDLLILSEYILGKLCMKMNIETKKLSEEVKNIFLNYNWSGNVRELENVLEYAINFSKTEIIQYEDIPEYLIESEPVILQTFQTENKKLKELVKKYERDILSKYIKVYGDTVEDKKIIAKHLGIGLTTLYRIIEEYN